MKIDTEARRKLEAIAARYEPNARGDAFLLVRELEHLLACCTESEPETSPSDWMKGPLMQEGKEP